MKIKEMLKDSRPRERLVKFGVENLSDAELLTIILQKGTREENVIEMSNRLIIVKNINIENCITYVTFILQFSIV